MTEFTLGGYMAAHDRAAAFTGSDERAYSVALWVDDEPDARGRFGGALLFVRWAPDGDAPDGHLESGYLVWGNTPDDATARLGALSLYDVKAQLDELIAAAPPAIE
ncbi:MAG TPA: hypothetical protein PLJ23_10380 [Gemmatimonadales bacterium]|nr:hypothetical protein [Gemmatimonadales bacterium]